MPRRNSPPPQKSKRLSPRHLRFIDEYLMDREGNGTAAALRAGYGERRANRSAYEMLKRPDVQAEIARRRTEATSEVKVGMQDVILGLHKEATLTGEGSTQGGRVAAWTALGKFLGGDKLALVGDPNNPIVHEIRRVIVDPKSDGARG